MSVALLGDQGATVFLYFQNFPSLQLLGICDSCSTCLSLLVRFAFEAKIRHSRTFPSPLLTSPFHLTYAPVPSKLLQVVLGSAPRIFFLANGD